MQDPKSTRQDNAESWSRNGAREQIAIALLHGYVHLWAHPLDRRNAFLQLYRGWPPSNSSGIRIRESAVVSASGSLSILLWGSRSVLGASHFLELLHGSEIEPQDRGLQQGVFHDCKPRCRGQPHDESWRGSPWKTWKRESHAQARILRRVCRQLALQDPHKPLEGTEDIYWRQQQWKR